MWVSRQFPATRTGCARTPRRNLIPATSAPRYTREDTRVSVETNVYATSKPDGDLVWTGVSDSFNPKSAKKVADGLLKEVSKQMEKDGRLPKNFASN